MKDLSDLPLFQQAQDKLETAWQRVKIEKPWLLSQLADLAIEAKRRGLQHWSADALFHVLRWETGTKIGDLGLKANNNHTALVARDLMNEYPELKGFFRTRVRKAHGNWGQLH
jgi:hypothetical protein